MVFQMPTLCYNLKTSNGNGLAGVVSKEDSKTTLKCFFILMLFTYMETTPLPGKVAVSDLQPAIITIEQ